jgi:protein dispatched 1
MLSLICIMVLKKWEMGISESVAVVLLIGLSVDYVVHLAAHISHSQEILMLDKLRETYSEIAISITSAAATTFGCGAFLFGG